MLPAEAGLNRFVWNLQYEGASKVPHAPLWGGSTDGPKALPGKYQVRLTVLGKTYTEPLEIQADPRLKITQADLQKQFDLLIKIRDKVTQTDDTINQIRDLRDQINAINKRLKNDARAKAVADAGKSLDKKSIEVEEALIQTKAKSGQDVLNFPIRLNNQARCVRRRGRQRRFRSHPAVLRSFRHAQQIHRRATREMESHRRQRRKVLQRGNKAARRPCPDPDATVRTVMFPL